ncbi:hypothetical protein AAMO2058_000080700 [Amorphochlora amoebiformis]
MAGSAGDETYAKNETVLALHGPKLYKAKISKVKPATSDEEAQYYVHYHKWSKKWDEWITAERIKKFSAENEKLQKNLEARYEKKMKGKANKSKKRQREEVEEEHPSPGMKITLPAELKKRLIDDWEHINRHDRVMQLPVKPSVEEILNFYLSNIIEENKKPSTKDVKQSEISKNIVNALKIYFEHSLGQMLLYRLERPLYEEKVKAADNTAISMYGAIHLLRLFVKMPTLCESTGLTDQQKEAIGREINNLCGHIVKKKSHILRGEYKKQSKEHLEKAKNVR